MGILFVMRLRWTVVVAIATILAAWVLGSLFAGTASAIEVGSVPNTPITLPVLGPIKVTTPSVLPGLGATATVSPSGGIAVGVTTPSAIGSLPLLPGAPSGVGVNVGPSGAPAIAPSGARGSGS